MGKPGTVQAICAAVSADGGRLSDGALIRLFAESNDQAAFAALFRRYGGMVLGVCRRALPCPQDAEDACQATFLVLAQKAKTQRWRPSLANWLYTTARKVARNARVAARRRARREGAAAVPEAVQPVDRMTGRELLSALDEELDRLAPHYREPLVLCYLRGLTRDQAADRLGVPVATIKIRLERGRKKLAAALAKRGCALGAGLLAVAATVPARASEPRLLESVLAAVAGRAPATVTALAAGVTVKPLLNRTAIVLLALLGAGLLGAWVSARPPARPAGAARAAPPAEAGQVFTYAGRVVGPDGKPVAGAKLSLCGLTPGVIEFRARAVSGRDGTFRFTVRRDEFGDKGVMPAGRGAPGGFVLIGATAAGYGGTCVGASRAEEREKLTLRLPAEEVVRGRVIDLQGKAVVGLEVSASARATREDKDHRPLPYDAPSQAGQFSGNILPFEAHNAATTDRDGKFTLRGLSRGWLYDLHFAGKGVANSRAGLAARPQKPDTIQAAGVWVPGRPGPQLPLYGSTFTHVVTPAKPIRGVVRDKGSGKPLAGFTVRRPWTRDDDSTAEVTTDKQGRFLLPGLASGTHPLQVEPRSGSPYLPAEVTVNANQPGIAPVTVNIDLERQSAISGQVLDHAGKPVRGQVEYRPLARNPDLKRHPFLATPNFRNHPPSTTTDAAGNFTLPVLRGPGVLLVRADADYLPARLAKSDRAIGVVHPGDKEIIDSRPRPAWPGEFHAYRLIEGRAGQTATVEIRLAAGRSRRLVIEYPDGKPRDTSVLGLKPGLADHGTRYEPGTNVIAGLADGEARRVFASTSDGKFAAATVVDGKGPGPVTLKLKPTGSITGRVVDAQGKPIAGVSFRLFFEDGPGRPGVFVHGGLLLRGLTKTEYERFALTRGYYSDDVRRVSLAEKTDDKGKFRIGWLVPEVAFDLVALPTAPDGKGRQTIRGEVRLARPTVKAGQTLDVGDLRSDRAEK
jgi:RNA polymerase sigma factor (sigma-70 family)